MNNKTKNLYSDTTKRDKNIGVLVVAGIVVMLSVIFIFAIPIVSSTFCNTFIPTVEAREGITKEVADVCVNMISAYNADLEIYEKFKTANNPEKFQWAQRAKKRANSTAEFYNEYFEKYSYIWSNNPPPGILDYLPPVE